MNGADDGFERGEERGERIGCDGTGADSGPAAIVRDVALSRHYCAHASRA
jgi:hypothetical protein